MLGSRVITWSTPGILPCNKVLTIGGTAEDLNHNVGQISGTVTTAACPVSYWNPVPVIATMGSRATSASQLPAGCTDESMQCWRDAVMNGTVKLLSTTATMVGVNSRPIIFSYFRNAAGMWNFIPMYADTGMLVGNGLNGGGTTDIDWVQTFDKGLYVHAAASNKCYANTWFPPNDPSGNSNVWSTNQIDCSLIPTPK
jgi:hypothetical protein